MDVYRYLVKGRVQVVPSAGELRRRRPRDELRERDDGVDLLGPRGRPIGCVEIEAGEQVAPAAVNDPIPRGEGVFGPVGQG